MKQMKYIIVDNGMYDAPVIFDEGVQHFNMARQVGGKVIAAGFIRWTQDGMECYGMSTSLGVASRPEDTKLINRMIGGPND